MTQINGELLETVRRLRNWHHWQISLRGVGRGYPGNAFAPGSSGTQPINDHNDAELVEAALSIFVKSWGRPPFLKLKNYIGGTEPIAELARRSGQSRYKYETEIQGLLHKVAYCIDHVERIESPTGDYPGL